MPFFSFMPILPGPTQANTIFCGLAILPGPITGNLATITYIPRAMARYLMTLRTRMVLRFVVGLGLVSALLFVPAGTWHFWQAWLLMAITFLSSLVVFLYLAKHDPQLAERRLQTK
jgi:hypothetical protein